jgi:ABC-2 type transport system permease protein
VLNLMVTPLREVEYVAGVVGALVFFSFDTSSLGYGLLPIASVLLVVGWAISLLVIGLVLRFGSGAEALAWGVMFVLMPLSGVFYPVENLPAVLQPIAKILPTTHAFEALRGLVDDKSLDWGQVAFAAIGSAVLLALSLWWLTAMLTRFRKRGYITRYT